jgi:hypothetical protein
MLQDPDAEKPARVIAAMMQMEGIDASRLKCAYGEY